MGIQKGNSFIKKVFINSTNKKCLILNSLKNLIQNTSTTKIMFLFYD